MKQRRRFFLIAAVLSAAVWAAAAGPAAAAPQAAARPAAGAGPEAVATAYLQARAAAVRSLDPATPLAQYVVPGSGLMVRERIVALGMALNALKLGHLVDSLDTAVSVSDVTLGADGASAKVSAHVITTITWHTRDNLSDVEANGVDHVLSLTLTGRGWRVGGDEYADVMVPAYLEDAGAPHALAQKAARQLERASHERVRDRVRWSLSRIRTDRARVRLEKSRAGGDATARAYLDTIVYKRDSAASYADRYCLSYCPSAVRFSADCANFVSQCAWAGRMPTSPAAWDAGWWYDSHGTSSPSDDTYSWSWINVGKQMGFWNGLRTDWVSSVNDLGRGDAIYYDWSGDGVWDHVAMVVGANSAGQKVIDAHTTDHYHVYWKLGSSAARYKFGRVRAQWIV